MGKTERSEERWKRLALLLAEDGMPEEEVEDEDVQRIEMPLPVRTRMIMEDRREDVGNSGEKRESYEELSGTFEHKTGDIVSSCWSKGRGSC